HRARHGTRHGDLRSRDGPRLRGDHRLRGAGRDPVRPAGDRGVSQRADGGPLMAPLLSLESISVHYGAICALRDVSIEVNSGEIVTLIGSNGAGKSTTLRAVSALRRPSSGKISFEGKDLAGKKPH